MNYLTQHKINYTKTKYWEFVTATAPVFQWEEILNTEFYTFKLPHESDRIVIRSLQYTIPSEVDAHIDAIFNTVQFPMKSLMKPPKMRDMKRVDISKEQPVQEASTSWCI